MRNLLVVLIISLAVLATACGDDAPADVGDTTPDDTVPDDTAPDDTVPDDTAPDDTTPDDEPILGAGPYPIADLTVTVTLAEGGDPQGYRITCLGDTATLTGDDAPSTGDAMCLALAEGLVRDRIVLGEATDRACTEQWGGPETARITGTFDGAEVDTSFHRSDGCGIGDWDLLNRVLPSPT